MPGFRVAQEPLTANGFAPEPAGGLLLTRPSAAGSARLTSLSQLHMNPALFPDLKQVKPLIVLTVENFGMTFPSPQPC
ncbi:hypothetical protein [Spirosoma arcticum]